MNSKDILGFCLEKGFLIDKEALGLFSEEADADYVKILIENLKNHTKSRVITKRLFYENKEQISEFFSQVPDDKKETVQKLKIKLGLSIEIVSRDVGNSLISEENSETKTVENPTNEPQVKIISMFPPAGRKMAVDDFVTHFRNRFTEMKFFLQERMEMSNLVSINKISGNRQQNSIIGMVIDKKTTKNKNIFLEVEDLTGKIKVLINQNKKELYELANNLCLDAVVGFKGSGSREIFFANDLFLPETTLHERKSSPVEECAVFISDIHVGSKLFLEKDFLKFIDYLNGKIPNTPESEKIKYLFIVGDLVAGVGVYPNQEKDLEIKDIEGQYSRMAELLGKIRSDIKIIILPGNHDCVRLAEPQPVLDEKFTWPIYNLKNVIMTSNPSVINIGARKNFSGFDVLAYHGFSYFYYANNVPKLTVADAINAPDKIMHYLLQHRHLAPSHTSVQYSPYDKDPLVIRKAPDIFVSGHTHKGAVSYYNNILVISSTCWEDLTAFQEKVGAKPDFCKVPMVNLKTRQVKILDFEDDEHKSKIREIMMKNENS